MQARDILARLIAFDTTSSRSNLALIRWIADYLAGHGIAARLTHDEAGAKANLFATIGPLRDGGIVLSGHTDVVPVAGQDWDSDPFALVEREDRLYGRGTADMKSFIALALALVPLFKEKARARPLHFAFSYDEEVGCLGVPRLLADLPVRPSLAIIGEPTGMKVAHAHKGCHVYRLTARGREAHSSAPQRGVSAILAAHEIVALIVRLAEERKLAAASGTGFDPPYTTFNIGAIDGGTAVNIVPGHCSVAWDMRPLPGEDPTPIRAEIDAAVAALDRRLRSGDAASHVRLEELVVVPALAAGPDSPAVRLAMQLTGANDSGTIAFATEAGHFMAHGIPAVVCGPGSIDQAHQPNEFIAADQLAAGTAFLERLAERLGEDGARVRPAAPARPR